MSSLQLLYITQTENLRHPLQPRVCGPASGSGPSPSTTAPHNSIKKQQQKQYHHPSEQTTPQTPPNPKSNPPQTTPANTRSHPLIPDHPQQKTTQATPTTTPKQAIPTTTTDGKDQNQVEDLSSWENHSTSQNHRLFNDII